MAERKKTDTAFALSDIILGGLGLLFFIFGRFTTPYISSPELLSTPFLISIALPSFILLSGIASLARVSFGPMTSLFVSFLAIVNSLAAILSNASPLFLVDGAPSALRIAFQYAIPSAALAYFTARGVVAFLTLRRVRRDADTTAASALPRENEIYCAACGEKLHPADETCPSCGALIRGRRCDSCGHEAPDREFADGHCPQCGAANDSHDE
jgi:predicted RNA-binding Zn-ribbon protein involved in translation (DUF1610 family)